MGRFLHLWLTRAWLGVLGIALLTTAVAKDADKPESQAKAKTFKTRFFPLAPGLFPAEKSAGSKKGESVVPLNRDVRTIFKEFGIEFPAGTGATYCEEHGMLVATHTPEVLEQIEQITGRSCGPPAQIETELDLVEMTTSTFDQLSAQKLSERSVVAPDLLEKLRQLEASGKAVVVDRIHDRNTSGGSSEQRHIVEHACVEDYQVKNGLAQLKYSAPRETGLLLDCNHRVGPDHFTISSALSWEYVLPIHTTNKNAVRLPGFDKPVPIEKPSIQKVTGKTYILMYDGQTVFIGTFNFQPGDSRARDDNSPWVYGFLTTRIVPRKWP